MAATHVVATHVAATHVAATHVAATHVAVAATHGRRHTFSSIVPQSEMTYFDSTFRFGF
jgi:hypothetical protein